MAEVVIHVVDADSRQQRGHHVADAAILHRPIEIPTNPQAERLVQFGLPVLVGAVVRVEQ